MSSASFFFRVYADLALDGVCGSSSHPKHKGMPSIRETGNINQTHNGAVFIANRCSRTAPMMGCHRKMLGPVNGDSFADFKCGSDGVRADFCFRPAHTLNKIDFSPLQASSGIRPNSIRTRRHRSRAPSFPTLLIHG